MGDVLGFEGLRVGFNFFELWVVKLQGLFSWLEVVSCWIYHLSPEPVEQLSFVLLGVEWQV